MKPLRFGTSVLIPSGILRKRLLVLERKRVFSEGLIEKAALAFGARIVGPREGKSGRSLREVSLGDAQSEARIIRVMRGLKRPCSSLALTLTAQDKREVVECAVEARKRLIERGEKWQRK